MEAAIDLSGALTTAAIQHSFPSGSLIRFLAYKLNGKLVKNTSCVPEKDSQKAHWLFEMQTSPFRTLAICPHFD
jgi:hypothetical protein